MSVLTAPPKTKLITGEELLAMGDIGPCELIDGRIVSMVPTGFEHGLLETGLAAALRDFARQHNLGWVLTGEVGIYIRRNPDRIRGADIVLLSRERAATPPTGFLDIAPDLVVEILSPHERWQDVREKLADYFSIGVDQVWLVEPQRRTLLVYKSTADVWEYGEDDILVGEGILNGFQLRIADLFAEI